MKRTRAGAHAQTQRNVAHARELGYHILEPETGLLAAGEGSGPGRMPEPETILAHAGRMLEGSRSLAGVQVVVTAGPTREPLDPVRYLSNHSSGKMGVEVAAAAWRRGATVRLVAGPMSILPPAGVAVTAVETTAEMAEAVRAALPEADVLVMAAAPADFRPAAAATSKIKKGTGPAQVDLVETPDILLTTRDHRKAGAVIVGFALETNDVLANGRKKLATTGLDLVVVNDATEAGAGFGGDTNRVTIVARSGEEETLPLMSKRDVADAILDRVEKLRRGT